MQQLERQLDCPTPPKYRASIRLRLFPIAACVLLFGWAALSGCAPQIGFVRLERIGPVPRLMTRKISAGSGWIDTGIEVTAGQALSIRGYGRARIDSTEFGPEGTYSIPEETQDLKYPLPVGLAGPAPIGAVLGRIDRGLPFFVGAEFSDHTSRSGRLELSINAPDGLPRSHLSGHFTVEIDVNNDVAPIWHESVFHATASEDRFPTVPAHRVVVFYVDGLRPDVVREMAAMGQIPHIKQHFVVGGSWFENCFTAFPSDTVTSNGTMWTGCFSDRHGIKSQVQFSRRTLDSESRLEPLGPSRTAQTLTPSGLDGAFQQVAARAIESIGGTSSRARWTQRYATEVAPLYRILRDHGQQWATGILPIMEQAPPELWARSLARVLPYFQAHRAWEFVDDANTHYSLQELNRRDDAVTVIWLPETDSVSHKRSRGQFGATRRTIVDADRLIGSMISDLQQRDQLDRTVFFLISDHGHHGGRTRHLQHFDITSELLFAPRQVDADGHWVGGGLGASVRQHRQFHKHPSHSNRSFVFVDGENSGTARIFFPRGSLPEGRWDRPNSISELLNYEIARHQPRVNLIDWLVHATLPSQSHSRPNQPIDLVMVRISESAILVATADRGQAVIERRFENGQWLYRYTPIDDIDATPGQAVSWQRAQAPTIDPLHLLAVHDLAELQTWNDEQRWLERSLKTPYPDGVIAFTRHLLWDREIQHREREFAPDIVVTARPGWYFGSSASPGSTHGHPTRDAMQASWFVSGSGIAAARRIQTPVRLVDLTPTILALLGISDSAADFDGRDRSALLAAQGSTVATPSPVYWSDVNLAAWQPLDYQPRRRSKFRPPSVNRPRAPGGPEQHRIHRHHSRRTQSNPSAGGRGCRDHKKQRPFSRAP